MVYYAWIQMNAEMDPIIVILMQLVKIRMGHMVVPASRATLAMGANVLILMSVTRKHIHAMNMHFASILLRLTHVSARTDLMEMERYALT